MSDWKELPLNDVIELVIDHRGKTPKKLGFDDFFSEGYPVLSAKHVKTSGLVNLDAMRFANEEMYKKWMKEPTQKGDVILTSEAPLGELFYIDGSKKYVLGQRVFGLRPKSDVLDSMYLLVWLSSAEGQGRLQARATGSTVQGIKQSELLKIMIPIPPMEVQKDIASIYGSLDQKIQLNTQINQTLEQIAQSLFKSWFVDFDPVRAKVQALSDGLSLEQAELAAMQAISGKTPEELTALSQAQPDRYAELAETAKAFPCEMVEVDGVEVPKGWKYKPADELFDIGIGKTPPRKETEWFSTNPDDMQWISIKDMGNSGVFITESSEFLTNQAVDKFNIRKIPENTVLLSFKLTIGRVSITTCETTTNEAIAHFKITNKSFLTTEYLYLFFQQFDFNSLGSTSSIATAVNSKTIKGIEILIPNEELIKAFQMKISNIFVQIKNLTMENKNLVKTRDLLLPKLLNREI
ncbi:restriction endonuclease subunit S [Haemophilus parainfluenzae]|uniref:restriction endonuclease subunit S n=1 Tax=Haemophilus parainfluenzae TaxID=729 RepID=UPI000E288A2C|nr:restriction endonuclease subunit S [Haemophilus parainfluenzae]